MGERYGGCEKRRWGCEEVRGKYGVSVGKCVGLWGRWRERYGWFGEGKKRCGGCEEVWGNVWESEWGECGGCRKVCWGEGVRKCVGVWESYD